MSPGPKNDNSDYQNRSHKAPSWVEEKIHQLSNPFVAELQQINSWGGTSCQSVDNWQMCYGIKDAKSLCNRQTP